MRGPSIRDDVRVLLTAESDGVVKLERHGYQIYSID
jgi:hypothetical protein